MLSCNRADYGFKALLIRKLALVESAGLLIKIAEKVKRLNRDIRALQAALQQAPVIFKSIGVDVTANVSFGMINCFMNELILKALI